MNYNWLSDVSVFQVNRLETKAHMKTYRNEEERLAKKTSFRRCLNGMWKFEFATSVDSCNKEFWKEGYDASSWDEIKVPGHFQTQGYGKAMYVNHVNPWSGREQLYPGDVPKYNEIGSYIKEVELTKDDLKERVHICFHGVESAFALWVNGQFIGYSEDSFAPSYFDITSAVKEGKNHIAVQVYRFCSESWLEGQDFFRLSGIHRDVELVFVPQVYLQDLKVLTPLFDNYTRANVNVDLEFRGNVEDSKVCITLQDKDGNKIESNEIEGKKNISVSYEVMNPNLWSSEHPYLYSLLVEVYVNGQLIEVTEQRVGIREFKIIDGIMCINGKRIVFHGVNRHEFAADVGRALSKGVNLFDIQTMKANNINALRTSHYPNSEYVYDLCDEYGLYLCSECNLETHGTWMEFWDMDHVIPKDDMKWLPAIEDRALSMYERDKNHASIIMWSIGNESYGGKVVWKESEFLRSLDESRVIQYESLFNEELYSGKRKYPDTSDVESQMYSYVKDIEKFIQERPEKPFMLCEYSHSMGNSNGGLFKYIELEKKYPKYQGGFIWDWVDQALYDDKGILRYGGDFRERPSDYEFCGNGLLFGDRTISPKMQEVKYCYQYIDTVIDENQIQFINNYLFSNLNEFTYTIECNKNGVCIEKTEPQRIDCQPGQTVQIENPFIVECNEDQYDVIVRFNDNTDHEVAYQQYVYEKKVKPRVLDIPMHYSEDFLNIGIQLENRNIIFNKKKGLVSYNANGEEMIRLWPRPNFFRAATNNDIENGYGRRYGQWMIASLYSTVEFIKVEKEDTFCKVYYEYKLPKLGDEKVKVTYTVTGDGSIDVDMDYQPSTQYIEMPAFGMIFHLYPEYDYVKYFGMGPKENYIDRNKGALLGQYSYKVKDNVTPYLYPQECGNRTGTQSIHVMSKEHKMMFNANNIEFSALPYTPFELENARHEDELPNPYQTVVCLYSNQMGVGGDDTWGARTLDEFLLSNKEHQHLHFTMKGE